MQYLKTKKAEGPNEPYQTVSSRTLRSISETGELTFQSLFCHIIRTHWVHIRDCDLHTFLTNIVKKLNVKPCGHLLFTHAFSTLRCILEVLTLIGRTKIGTLKTHCNVDKACINSNWQCYLKLSCHIMFSQWKQNALKWIFTFVWRN